MCDRLCTAPRLVEHAEDSERPAFIEQTLLALRGWAGMLWQLESRRDRVTHPAPPGTLLEFCAVRLLLDRLALAHVAREALGYAGDLAGLRGFLSKGQSHAPGAPRELTVTQRTFRAFLLAQSQGWSPRLLFTLERPRAPAERARARPCPQRARTLPPLPDRAAWSVVYRVPCTVYRVP